MTLPQYLQTSFGIYSRVRIFLALMNHFVFHCDTIIVSVPLKYRKDHRAEISPDVSFQEQIPPPETLSAVVCSSPTCVVVRWGLLRSEEPGDRTAAEGFPHSTLLERSEGTDMNFLPVGQQK